MDLIGKNTFKIEHNEGDRLKTKCYPDESNSSRIMVVIEGFSYRHALGDNN